MTDQPAAPVDPGATTFTHRQILVIFSGLMLGMLLAALDQTIVATALPTITGELGGLDHISWVVTSYLLASTCSTPLYGKLGDLYGRKRLFQTAIVIFLVGSVVSGLAQNMGQLIAFRAVQGLGGGGLIVLAQSIIADVVSPRERGRYQGYFGAVFGTSSIAGPLLGGFFTDHLSWRWVFYINVPLGILALFVTSAVLPAGIRRAHKVDYLGSALLVGAVTCVVLFTTWGGSEHAWGSPTIVGLIVASVVLVPMLLVVERRAAEPVVPVHLFSQRTFRVAGSTSFIVGVAMLSAISFLPLFVQVVNGASATSSGLLLLPLMLALPVASVVSGAVISRTGRYKAFPVAGTATITVAMFLLSTMGTDTSRATVAVYMVVLGIGIGFTMQTLVLATQNSVPVGDLGVATASISFFRSMGGSIGVAVFGAIFNARLTAHIADFTVPVGEASVFTPESVRALPPESAGQVTGAFADSLTTVFLYAVPLVAVGAGLTWLLREVPLRSAADIEELRRAAGRPPGSDAAEVAVSH